MRDQLSSAAHQEPIFAEAPVLFACVRRGGSKPEIGVGHDGPHAVHRDIGAGHAEQSASLIVNGLGYADQGLGTAGVQKWLAEIGLAGALGAAVPLALGVVIVVSDGSGVGKALPVDAKQRVLIFPILLLEGDVNALNIFEDRKSTRLNSSHS